VRRGLTLIELLLALAIVTSAAIATVVTTASSVRTSSVRAELERCRLFDRRVRRLAMREGPCTITMADRLLEARSALDDRLLLECGIPDGVKLDLRADPPGPVTIDALGRGVDYAVQVFVDSPNGPMQSPEWSGWRVCGLTGCVVLEDQAGVRTR